MFICSRAAQILWSCVCVFAECGGAFGHAFNWHGWTQKPEADFANSQLACAECSSVLGLPVLLSVLISSMLCSFAFALHGGHCFTELDLVEVLGLVASVIGFVLSAALLDQLLKRCVVCHVGQPILLLQSLNPVVVAWLWFVRSSWNNLQWILVDLCGQQLRYGRLRNALGTLCCVEL